MAQAKKQQKTKASKKATAKKQSAAIKSKSHIARLKSVVKQKVNAYKRYRQEDKKVKKYRSFRLQKKIKPEPRIVPTSYQLIKSTGRFLYQHKTIFLALICVHGILYMGLIRNPVETDISSIQESVKTILGDKGELQKNVATLGAVLNTTNTSQSNSASLSAVVVCASLIYIWAIRQLHLGKEIRARDALYQGTTSLGSSLLILTMASIQLLPFAVTSFVYATARANGLFVTGFEDLAVFALCMLTGLLSFYWMTSTVIALYIVTLPGVYPMEALRAAKKIVQFQRFMVFRRIIALPVILLVSYFLILLLFIRFMSGQVFLVVDIMHLLLFPIIHVYLFKLYRSLL